MKRKRIIMLQQLRQARKNESGFTLIELLIVIVILGVLSGIVVFAVSGIQDRGNAAACKSDRSTVEVAVEAYYAKNTAYPDAGAAGYLQLTTAPDKFLRSAPTATMANGGYVITLGADGVVTASGACT
ncbi:type II secretion system protein [Kribbella sp. NPDC051620]|uniref:type II secretion system protein n=1 Tax=Kribbella sp. NPDC051620 TaxID=3364120 RepID=UPI0037AC641C